MKSKSSATVFTVKNLDKSLAHYKEVFGFEEDFRFGSYAGIKMSNVNIHLAQYGTTEMKKPGSGNLYIFCDEVDSYYPFSKMKCNSIFIYSSSLIFVPIRKAIFSL